MIQVQFPFPNEIDGGLELPVLQPGAPNVQLLGGDAEVGHFRRRHGEAHGDDPPGISGHPDQRAKGILCAGAVDGQGGSVGVRRIFFQLCVQVLLQEVNRSIRAVFQRCYELIYFIGRSLSIIVKAYNGKKWSSASNIASATPTAAFTAPTLTAKAGEGYAKAKVGGRHVAAKVGKATEHATEQGARNLGKMLGKAKKQGKKHIGQSKGMFGAFLDEYKKASK